MASPSDPPHAAGGTGGQRGVQAPSAWTDALADTLCASGGLPAELPTGQAEPLAWALQRQCLAAWSSDPPRAVRAAGLVQALSQRWPDKPAVRALAAWSDGMACLIGGQMADGAARLDHAARQWQALGQPLPAAQCQVPKVMALSMLGRLDEAAACGEQVQQALQALGDLAAASKVSLNLGSLQILRDDHAAAAGHYRQAAVLFARLRDHKHSVMADIGLGDALTMAGDMVEAGLVYARARMRAAQHELPLLQAMADESQALLDLASGAFDAALAALERSRRAYQALALPQHLANAEKQLADAYLELRLLPEALALYDQALSTMQPLDMPNDRAWTLLQRGRALALLGRLDEADAHLAQAGAQFEEQASGSGSAAVALAQAERALQQGDAQRARALADSAHEAYQRAEMPEAAVRATLVAGTALLSLGQPAQARASFEQALTQARQLQLLTQQVRCLAGLGQAAWAQGARKVAAHAFHAAVVQFEAQWRLLPGDELRSAFQADHLLQYQGLLALALADHADHPGHATAAQVLVCIDNLRARALADRLQQQQRPSADPAVDSLRTHLGVLHRRVQRQADEGESSAGLVALLRSTEQALLEQARRLRLTNPPVSAGNDAGQALDVAGLQALLAADEALVVYGQQGDELLACVVRRDGLQLHRHVALWTAVEAAARGLRFQMEALRHGAAPVQAHLAQLGQRAEVRLQQLHALVWAPLAPAVANATRVLVVPVAGLSDLPFAALHDGRAHLVQHHALALAPSVRVAAWGLGRAVAAPLCVLALGEASRLPHAGAEAQAVAAQFPQGTVCLAEQAIWPTLQSLAPQADVLHLACHAQFRSDNPMFSALHLHDGPLSAERVETLNLRPGTVVLSACESGLAGQHGGDEQVGLVRAFLVAGAARVLASLWPVDDAITAELMRDFYRVLQAGNSPALALQAAQAGLMQRHPHPAQWAGFTLYGGW